MSEVWILYDMSQGWTRIIAVYDSEENARDAELLWRRVNRQDHWSTSIEYIPVRHNNAIPITEYPDDEVTE